MVANVAVNILLFYFTIVSQFPDCVSASASGLAAHFRPGSLRLNSPVTRLIEILIQYQISIHNRFVFFVSPRYGAVFGLVTAAILFKDLDSGTRQTSSIFTQNSPVSDLKKLTSV